MLIRDLAQDTCFHLHWQMTNCERFALVGLLQRRQPKLSLEVGTYQGGSLQALSLYSERVLSIDIEFGVAERLRSRFSNVEFRSGDSRALLPAAIAEINRGTDRLEFVLVDGDHSREGVRWDIENVLLLVPRTPVVLILHDSFNPDCRAGMRSAAWSRCPYVHEVELDFVPGIYHYEAYDTASARTMWGGFACAVLEPQPRRGPLQVKESQKGLFEAVFKVSAHAQPPVSRPSMAGRVRAVVTRVARRAVGNAKQ